LRAGLASDTLNPVNTLLVVTSDFSFGDLIRKSLEGEGRFSVGLAADQEAALAYLEQAGCQMAFMDTCLSEKKILEIGEALRHANSEIRYIIISEAGWHSSLEELSPVNYLAKPFQPQELIDMMNNLFGKDRPDTLPVTDPPEARLPWLSDVTRAAQHLTRLTLETSAQAALITCQEQLWAYAGQLPQTAARELAEAVSRYWDRQKENDLVRFLRLNATDAEHMLYATRLAKDMVLALIFDAETPFSTIRTQANQLVHSLSTLPEDRPAEEEFEEDDEAPTAAISDILSDIPSPNPQIIEPVSPQRGWKAPNPAVPLSFGKSLRFSRETSPAVPINRAGQPSQSETDEPHLEEIEKTVESATLHRKNWFRRNDLTADMEYTETKPSSATEMARKITLEPISPAVYNLDYACLLVPRLPQHHLTGDLSDQVSDWVPQICVAFGWRLEYISVRPEYLLWIANVPPSTSPAYLMRILRQHTSDRIFPDFPRLHKENPSGDFWAAGYLIMGGSQPPPGQLIKDFISQTRQRQGFTY
jgi:DNA-binding response OmpR family regulator/REP element-mobilizing transposase RayT